MSCENKLTVVKSGISGKGVFAVETIYNGETICLMNGEECSIDEMIRRVDDDEENGSDPLGIDDEMYMDLDELPRSFNHSCSPNAFIRGRNELVALKEISAGEEICYDYSTTMNDNEKKIEDSGGGLWTCKCKCGEKNCRKKIDQFRTLPKETREFYLKNKLAPDFILRNFSQNNL